MKRIYGMMFCLLLIMICSLSLADVAIDKASFPDKVFRSHVKTYDTDGNGILSDDELLGVTHMFIEAMGIKNLKGIEFFTALEALNCANTGYRKQHGADFAVML